MPECEGPSTHQTHFQAGQRPYLGERVRQELFSGLAFLRVHVVVAGEKFVLLRAHFRGRFCVFVYLCDCVCFLWLRRQGDRG